ncbi:MAG TPA: hypothetical protein PKW14_01710 [Bacteroidota bacterium]|nr:hypothetical protein [Bacteroidota bacterium]
MIRKSNLFFIIIYFCFFHFSSFSQSRVLNNYEKIDSIYSVVVGKIINKLSCNSKNIALVFEGDSNIWILKNKLFDALRNNNFEFSDSSISNCKLNLYNETKIRYLKNYSNDDYFIREINCFVKLDFDHRIDVYSEKVSDTLKIDNLNFINNNRISVLLNDLEKKTFIEELLKPLVILTSSGILVYLLFTIRSK